MKQLTSRPLLGNRDYRLWWLGNVISSAGNQLSLIAMPLIVLRITGSPLHAGLVASAEAAPYLLLSLPVGVVVDRMSRRVLLVSSAGVSLCAFASIPALYAAGILTPGHLYIIALLNGAASVVFVVAQQAALPAIVEKQHLGAASAQAETVERLAAILGPPLAAFLFASVWAPLPFALDALTFAVMIALVIGIRGHLGPRKPVKRLNLKVDLLAGARTLISHRLLRNLTALNSAGDFLFAGIGLLMIVLVQDAGMARASAGFVFAVAAVGGAIGALLSNAIENRLGLAQAVVGKHVVTALLFPLLLLGLNALGIGLIWAAISFQVSILGVVQRKYVMALTADDLMGRVQSFTTFLSFGSLPLGTAVTGFLLEFIGADGTVIVYTVVLVALAIFSAVVPYQNWSDQ